MACVTSHRGLQLHYSLLRQEDLVAIAERVLTDAPQMATSQQSAWRMLN